MLSAELAFTNWRALHGYRWIRYDELGAHREQEVPMPTTWVLTEVHDQLVPDRTPRRYEAVNVLANHPTLFREFAAIGWNDRDRAIEFASRYGMLDADSRFNFPAERLPKDAKDRPPRGAIRGREIYVPCDPELYWRQCPAEFRVAIRVWECLKQNKVKELKEVFRWQWDDEGGQRALGSGPMGTNPRGHWIRRADPQIDGAQLLDQIVYKERNNPLDRWTPIEDVYVIARAYLRQFIEWGAEVGSLCEIRFIQEDKPRFQVRPQNLLAALYLQFGQTVGGNVEQQQCRCWTCNKWFNLEPKHRGRKEFCNVSCKSQDYRNRKERAEELKAGGKSAKAIAAEIDTPIETVQKWFQKRKDG